jgi:hypothetical protein
MNGATAMDDGRGGPGVTVNAIAVVDLTKKVASFLFQYSKGVLSAKGDINRL